MALTGWVTLLHFVPLFPLPPSPPPSLHAFIHVQYQFLWWMRMRMIFGNAHSYLQRFFAVYSCSSAKQVILHTLKRKQKKTNVLLRKTFFYPEEGVVPDVGTEAYKLQKFAEISADDLALASARIAQSLLVPEIHELWTSTFSEFYDIKIAIFSSIDIQRIQNEPISSSFQVSPKWDCKSTFHHIGCAKD